MIARSLDLRPLVQRKSLFLFGPRQTGKTSLIREQFPNARVYNLLDSRTFLELSRSPHLMRERWTDKEPLVVIDEVQRLPELLNEVQWMIDERKARFLLSGSSARRLRHKGVNLLGGRARVRQLHPFSSHELGRDFDLTRALNYGLLPSIYLSEEPEEDLAAYAGTYLREEVAAEGATRNIPAFSRFLAVAALSNGQLINYTNLANDAQVARTTVQEYFEILKDTLIGYELPSWKQSTHRKPLSLSKFFFFDPGVARTLQGRATLTPRTTEYGVAFEHYLFHELRTFRDYVAPQASLSYWKSKSGFEVDFVLADRLAVEAKATRQVSDRDLRGLKALREEKKLKHFIVVCTEASPRVLEGIRILPLQVFLEELWSGAFTS